MVSDVFAGFTGRAGRAVWWLALVLTLVAYFLISFLIISLATAGLVSPRPGLWEFVAVSPWFALTVWVLGGTTTRRLRALGAPLSVGWPVVVASWVLAVWIIPTYSARFTEGPARVVVALAAPVLLFWPVVWLGLFRGDDGSNKLGQAEERQRSSGPVA